MVFPRVETPRSLKKLNITVSERPSLLRCWKNKDPNMKSYLIVSLFFKPSLKWSVGWYLEFKLNLMARKMKARLELRVTMALLSTQSYWKKMRYHCATRLPRIHRVPGQQAPRTSTDKFLSMVYCFRSGFIMYFPIAMRYGVSLLFFCLNFDYVSKFLKVLNF
jgi:hypothetical protein